MVYDEATSSLDSITEQVGVYLLKVIKGVLMEVSVELCHLLSSCCVINVTYASYTVPRDTCCDVMLSFSGTLCEAFLLVISKIVWILNPFYFN